MEPMAQPELREQAIDALGSMRDPRAPNELRSILGSSNDVASESATVRALGRFGATDLAPRFRALACDPGARSRHRRSTELDGTVIADGNDRTSATQVVRS
jgi:HEAT repeat protein